MFGPPPTRFVTWATSSPCADINDEFDSWVWRRQCMEGLIVAATITRREAVVEQHLAGVYNLEHLHRWFPVSTVETMVALRALPANFDLQAASDASPVLRPEQATDKKMMSKVSVSVTAPSIVCHKSRPWRSAIATRDPTVVW